MKKSSWLLILLIGFPYFLLSAQEPKGPIDFGYVNSTINDSKYILHCIQIDVFWKYAVAFAIIGIGIVIALLKLITKGSAAKIASWFIVALGLIVTALGTIDSQFLKFDVNIGEKYSTVMQNKIREMDKYLRMWNKIELQPQIVGIVETNYEQILNLQTQYNEIKTGTHIGFYEGNTRLLNVLHAQDTEIKPAWFDKTPIDKNYFYVVGEGGSKDYSNSIQISENDGREKIESAIAKMIFDQKIDNPDIVPLSKLIASKSKIADQFTSLAGDGTIKSYSLMAIPRNGLGSYLKLYELKKAYTIPMSSNVKQILEAPKFGN
jgi:hypothetical protein